MKTTDKFRIAVLRQHGNNRTISELAHWASEENKRVTASAVLKVAERLQSVSDEYRKD